jgi:hypothetical protein
MGDVRIDLKRVVNSYKKGNEEEKIYLWSILMALCLEPCSFSRRSGSTSNLIANHDLVTKERKVEKKKQLPILSPVRSREVVVVLMTARHCRCSTRSLIVDMI